MARSEPVDADAALVQAVGLYALGEVNERRAAEIAGLTRWEMRAILEDAGLELRHGPETVEELVGMLASPPPTSPMPDELVALTG
jgi:predicted HTH domain antitoxin